MSWTVLLTAAGAVATFALGLLTDTWRTRLGINASKAERVEVRRLARLDRREDFELGALLGLQDVIPVMARQVGAGYHSDENHFRGTGRWVLGAPLLADAVGGEGSLAIRWDFARLKSRVPSPELRRILTDFDASCTDVTSSPAGNGDNDAEMRAVAIKRMGSMADKLVAAQDAVGERIRELYAD